METPQAAGRILVVDDSEVSLRVLAAILEGVGLQVVCTRQGSAALALALDLQPDLVLLDVVLPDVDGFEILRQLQAHELTRDLPVVMVTAKTQGDDVRRALGAGAFDYIKKPLDEVETVARVHSALRFKAQKDRLVQMATHDGLTGLYNHCLLVDMVSRELASARRRAQPVSYCMADIDHFKSFNDQWGHQAGDQALRDVSRLLTQGVRQSDPVGRYGGEEFGIVLAGCTLEGARTLCERLRLSVAEHPFEVAGRRVPLTVSIGLACAGSDETLEAPVLIRRADLALYRAKEAGRNRLAG